MSHTLSSSHAHQRWAVSRLGREKLRGARVCMPAEINGLENLPQWYTQIFFSTCPPIIQVFLWLTAQSGFSKCLLSLSSWGCFHPKNRKTHLSFRWLNSQVSGLLPCWKCAEYKTLVNCLIERGGDDSKRYTIINKPIERLFFTLLGVDELITGKHNFAF